MKRLALLLLLTGCSIRPAPIGPRVAGIRESQASNAAIAQHGTAASAAMSRAESHIDRSLAGLSKADAKALLLKLWIEEKYRKAP